MTKKIKTTKLVNYVFSVVFYGDDGETIIKHKNVTIKHKLIYKGDICQNYFIPYDRMRKKFDAPNCYGINLFYELDSINTIL